MRQTLVVLAVAAALGGCTSPEVSRMRAGGAGGDVGNRARVPALHEGADPYWKTPEILPKNVGMRDLAGARHADMLTRDGTASPAMSRR